MKRELQARPIVLAGALCLLWSVICSAGERQVVSWSEVKQDIAQYICIETDTAANGSERFYFKTGTGSPCVEGSERIPGIGKILAAARPLLVGIRLEDVGFSFDTSLTLDSLQRCLQNAYLSNVRFLRPILRRLEKQFASAGIACSDCPVLPEPTVRVVRVAEFLPYLVAYAWPDEVHTPIATNGDSTGKMNYTFHLCVELNGVDETIDHPDPYLKYLAFTVAMNSKQFFRLAYEHFSALLREESFQHLVDDSSRTQFLRQHLAERLGRDKHLIAAAKRALKEYYDDLQVRLE